MSGKCDADVVETTTIRIAPPSASEKNDRRAVRHRTRRRRPRKLRIDDRAGDNIMMRGGSADDDDYAKRIAFEPDVGAFVSGCVGTIPTRKRSLPMLSFLSSTQLAAAEKKRKREDAEIRNSIAEEGARKALLLNPIEPTTAGGQTSESPRSEEGPRAAATSKTVVREGTSNILMPPSLKEFLCVIGK